MSRLAVELVGLFGVPPAVLLWLRESGVHVPVIPVILVALVICGVLAAADRTLSPGVPEAGRSPTSERRRVLRTFGVGAIGLVGVTAVAAPAELFRLPFERTGLWLSILVIYPLLSVVPQELVFRAFFFHRYRALFESERGLWAASALTFGWVHALFGEPLSVVLSTIGGLLFGWTWMRTRSLVLVSIEHSLYGCFVFTVGLRAYFQSGA